MVLNKKVAFMIDGWFMRKRIYKTKKFFYTGPEIRKYCSKILRPDQEIYRIFYYDTNPLEKKGHNPITSTFIDFSETVVAIKQRELFESIKKTPNFALRLGETQWKNNEWILNYKKLKNLLRKNITVDSLTEEDVFPYIQQKTVDMKIGLDIALIALKKLADIMIVITGDVDIVPALKLARQEGIQVGGDPIEQHISPLLREHVDFIASEYKSKSPNK